MSTLTYRAEIDGLRAFAVMPVVLFHAGTPGFSGEFIGVDVFFVISGYLITSILLADLAAGRFSLLDFYERRARRILPALFAVIVICIPFAWLWMLPSEFAAFGKSIIATVFFGSNILFWRESGYFDPAAELKPLLHTWSLAVEEQYYLLFPIFLFLMFRFARRGIPAVLLVGIVISLGLAEWGWRNAQAAAFYLAPTRVWEILAGSVCAVLMQARGFQNRWLGLVGIGLIIGPIFGFDAATPVPSLWIAIPVLGTALVLLFATAGTPAAALLQFRPFVVIGLISYSTYLWHQPLLAFARIRFVSEPSALLTFTLVLAAFGLGWLSWKCVEAPFRRKSPAMARGTIFSGAVGGMLALSVIGFVFVKLDGLPSRQTPAGMAFAEIKALEATLAPNYGLHESCDSVNFRPSDACRTDPLPEAVLWGDSFAMHLAQALGASATPLDYAQATLSQCGPIPELAIQGSITNWQDCMAFNDAVLSWVLDSPSIGIVILSSPFRQAERPVYRRDGSRIEDPAERLVEIGRSLMALSQTLEGRGKRLVLISPPPQNGVDLGLCDLRNQAMKGAQSACDLHYEDYLEFSASAITLLTSVEDRLPVIWLADLLCAGGICKTRADGIGLYRDHGHLSFAGSAALGRDADLAGRIVAAAAD